MSKGNLPKSLRIHIRREKARIRRDVFDIKEQQKLIDELYQKHLKGNLPSPRLPEQIPAKSKQDKADKKTSEQIPAKNEQKKANKKISEKSPAKNKEKKADKKI